MVGIALIVHSSETQLFLFGHGLIGHSVNAFVSRMLAAQGQSLPYDWSDPRQRAAQRQALAAQLGNPSQIAIVWTAGTTGFGSPMEDVTAEHDLLAEVADWAGALQSAGHRVVFHLTSSAGGLFEGQSRVDEASSPAPRRPYGTGKLRQEQTVFAACAAHGFTATVYRPSSVYGFVPGRRMGLIATVIRNTLLGQPIVLTGATGTRRDYVLADDIGQYIATQALGPAAGAGVQLLASGLAVSIADILRRVADVMGTEPRVERADSQSNAADMSFAPEALPDAWVPTDLDAGIAACVRKIEAELAG